MRGAEFVPDDIVLNKVTVIERCLARIWQEYQGYEAELTTNFTRQDSIILNLLRTCEAAIDVAMHLTRVNCLGIPQDSRDAFSLLEQARLIPSELSQRLQAMVGFRNIAIHDYQKLNLAIVRSILKEHISWILKGIVATCWVIRKLIPASNRQRFVPKRRGYPGETRLLVVRFPAGQSSGRRCRRHGKFHPGWP